MSLISTRIPEDIEKELIWYANKERIGRTIALRKILDIGLKEIRLEYALDLYQKGKIGIGRAAKIANMSIWDILDIVREKRIPMNYTIKDVEKDLEMAIKLSKKLK